MIVCRVELWPGGDEARKREIGVLRVWNEDPHPTEEPPERSTYGYDCEDERGRHGQPLVQKGSGRGLQHRRSEGFWVLLRKVLERFG